MHLLLSLLVKHLDHKNVVQQPEILLDIVTVTTSLAEHAKVEPSVALLGAVGDIMKHWRKTIPCSLDDSKLGASVVKNNNNFHELIDKCLVQLANKVLNYCPSSKIILIIFIYSFGGDSFLWL